MSMHTHTYTQPELTHTHTHLSSQLTELGVVLKCRLIAWARLPGMDDAEQGVGEREREGVWLVSVLL